jgi:DNA modification methylase
MDINQTNVLNGKHARDEKDEKHICPLQLDVIYRCLEMWSNKGDVVFSPFAGIGSEGYQSIKQGRKFIGTELKESYWNQAVNNLKYAEASNEQLF